MSRLPVEAAVSPPARVTVFPRSVVRHKLDSGEDDGVPQDLPVTAQPDGVALLDSAAVDPTLARLDDQIAWYDRKSVYAQRTFKQLKVAELAAAAAIPVIAAFGVTAAVGAILGAVVVVLEGVQHLNQFQSNWITYRSTAEALKHEKYLHLAGAQPYDGDRSLQLLAERIEGLISQEHAKWSSAREETSTQSGTGRGG